jgi:2-polyprenyl-6-methoxyphenol hydroxylase-like FAD-dependent oxidoreductase
MPEEKLDQWHKTDLTVWRSQVASIWPQTAALTTQFTQHEQLAQARYAQFTVRSPWRGRLVLIGNAGHQTSPQLGQGANMALLDAVHLAGALMLHRDIDTALPAYAGQRQRHIRFYQSASAVLTQFFQSNSRLAGLVRDASFAPMARIP